MNLTINSPSTKRHGLLALLTSLFIPIGQSAAVPPPQTAGTLQKGDLVAICGDSITEAKMYTNYMAAYFLMCQPQEDLQAMQFGWSGETAAFFLKRQENDCLVFKPTVATTCWGMNDGGYRATDPNILNAYKTANTDIVRNFKKAGVRLIVVGGPGVVDTDTYKRNDPAIYNKTLADLAGVARQVATEEGVVFADVHGTMMEVMAKAKAKYGPGYAVAGSDGVHPGANGQLIMAYAFLKALGCDGKIGTITVDLKNNSATGTEGQKVISAVEGNIEVESSRYPFCFSGDPTQQTTKSIIEFLPFNEELNRYMLVVKNPASEKLKVTWGNTSKTFTASDLKEGINLAAEFPENPFSQPFAKVSQVIGTQQHFETVSMKEMMHSLIQWRQFLPTELAGMEKFAQAIIDRQRELRQNSRAAVVPVKHSIKIEPAA